MENYRKDTMNNLLKKINGCIDCNEMGDTAGWVSILKDFFIALNIEANLPKTEQ